VLVLLLVALSGGASDAAGQIRLGIAGGPVHPLGGLGDMVGRGFHGGVVLDAGLPLIPLGLRLELMYQRLPSVALESGDYSHVAATVNARMDVLPVPFIAAYLTGGAGLYASESFRQEPRGSGGWGTASGVNLGFGASFDLVFLHPFAELRYHRVFDDPRRGFAPLTIGFTLY
jgi:hypothetical protein